MIRKSERRKQKLICVHKEGKKTELTIPCCYSDLINMHRLYYLEDIGLVFLLIQVSFQKSENYNCTPIPQLHATQKSDQINFNTWLVILNALKSEVKCRIQTSDLKVK